MNLDPVINVKISGSMPSFEDSELDKLMSVCKSLGDGTEAEMIIRKKKKHRSNPQNAYYWGVVIKLIHDHTGQDANTIHGVLTGMFLKVKDWLDKERIRSTTELSTVEFEEYLEKCRQWAVIALDIYIPLPNEVEVPKEYETQAA